MDFTITSSTATDVVRLGDQREDVRRALGDHSTFRRTPDSEEADQFGGSGAMATYSSDGSLVMLELVDPARVEVEGVQLLGQPVEGVIDSLGARGVEVVPDDMGATIPSMSVGLYAPSGDVEGVQLGSD